jgi:hypothetical protein
MKLLTNILHNITFSNGFSSFYHKSQCNSRLFLKDQFVVPRFRIRFNAEHNAGKLPDHQVAGGIDDTACTKMTAHSVHILKGKRNMDMAALGADGAVQGDDLAMICDLTDIYATCIPYPSPQQTANAGKNHAGVDILFLADPPDRFQQILSPA